jgi:hypothetical protein
MSADFSSATPRDSHCTIIKPPPALPAAPRRACGVAAFLKWNQFVLESAEWRSVATPGKPSSVARRIAGSASTARI